jgi:putative transposase
MTPEITEAEVFDLINEIRNESENFFNMIRANVQETVGQYLSTLMDTKMTHFLGRDLYERCGGEKDHRNGSYKRKFTLKGIGSVDVKVPRDHRGDFKTEVMPRSKQY